LKRIKQKTYFIKDLDIGKSLKQSRNTLKISGAKYNSPIKNGPFEKIRKR